MKKLLLFAITLLIACNPVQQERRLCSVTIRLDPAAWTYAPHQWYKLNGAEFPTAIYMWGQEFGELPAVDSGAVYTITICYGTRSKHYDTLIVSSDTVWDCTPVAFLSTLKEKEK